MCGELTVKPSTSPPVAELMHQCRRAQRCKLCKVTHEVEVARLEKLHEVSADIDRSGTRLYAAQQR